MAEQQQPKIFWIRFLATGFFSGLSPKAPGTCGSLVVLPIAYLVMKLGPLPYLAITLLTTIFAIIVASLYEKATQTHDDKSIVIDEFAGQMIALALVPITWQSFVAAFVLFRFFDILKPPPIRQLDKKIQGGLGVVIDDVVAGMFANIILQVIYMRTSWLGVQLISP